MLAAHSKPGRASGRRRRRRTARPVRRRPPRASTCHASRAGRPGSGRRLRRTASRTRGAARRRRRSPAPTMTASAAPGLRRAAAIRNVSSLAKMIEVGMPMRPRNPSRNASDVRGACRHSPWMLAIFVVCRRSRISPAVKNSALFASVCPIMCITAPAAPDRSHRRGRTRSAPCARRCGRRASACSSAGAGARRRRTGSRPARTPRKKPDVQRVLPEGEVHDAPRAAAARRARRSAARPTAPAEMGDGVRLWASGSHGCIGHEADLGADADEQEDERPADHLRVERAARAPRRAPSDSARSTGRPAPTPA